MKRHGESNVSKVRWLSRQKKCDRGEYASKEEFVSVFECERVGLQRLALLLTANSEAAMRCLICAFRECIECSSVSRKWALSWIRRMVIRNAINLAMSPSRQSSVKTNVDADSASVAFSADDALSTMATYKAILDLPEFERFVFVICVLERYSVHDCALLLGKSPRELNEVRHWVGSQIGQIDERGVCSQCLSDELEAPVRSEGAK
jgi:DNA-directed RNA polymerase specialized sigma24 family protein